VRARGGVGEAGAAAGGRGVGAVVRRSAAGARPARGVAPGRCARRAPPAAVQPPSPRLHARRVSAAGGASAGATQAAGRAPPGASAPDRSWRRACRQPPPPVPSPPPRKVTTLVMPPEKHISVPKEELRLALKNRMELSERAHYDDLVKLMEGIASFDFVDLKHRMRSNFMPFATGARGDAMLQRAERGVPTTGDLDAKVGGPGALGGGVAGWPGRCWWGVTGWRGVGVSGPAGAAQAAEGARP
jgi:hypothetical protein